MVPIDKNLISKNLLSSEEKKWVNHYHKNVYKNLKSFMIKNELHELKKACSTI